MIPMDERKVNIKQSLLVFQRLVDSGVRRGGYYCLGDIRGQSDIDGYTVELTNGTVTLRIYFHNRYDIDFPNRRSLEIFLQQLEEIAAVSK